MNVCLCLAIHMHLGAHATELLSGWVFPFILNTEQLCLYIPWLLPASGLLVKIFIFCLSTQFS